jgi:hypothetical protein
VVLCQARSDSDDDGSIRVEVGPRGALGGDALEPYLVLGHGPGEPIDELVAADRTGRWIVIRKAASVRAIDTQGHTEIDLTALGADTRPDAIPYRDHRTISFDASGKHLLYVHEEEGAAEVVVRRLSDGTENRVDPGPGKLWRAGLDATGNWVVVQMITEDTTGNGRLGWPVPESERTVPQCAGPAPVHAAWQDRGDRPVTLVAPATGGKARLLEELVAPLEKRLLVRLPGGQIFAQTFSGKRRRFGAGKCLGHLVHADVTRELALFACEQDEGRPLLELRGPGYVQKLDVPVAGQATQVWPRHTNRLVPVYPGQDAVLVDLAKKRTQLLLPRDRVLLVDGPRALLRREDNLLVVNVDTGSETPLAALPSPVADVIVQSPMAVVTPFVVDVRQGNVIGTLSRRPLAVTTQGHVLVALGRDGDANQVARGPLLWQEPEPIAAPDQQTLAPRDTHE